MTETNTVLDALAADFPKSEVRQRDGGRGVKLDYIDIVSTINRLCSVLGASWDWRVLDAKVEVVENDGPKYLAYERGELVVTLDDGKTVITRGGSGADVDARDPDKAIKTADAEALKKAGHKFQIALYLWDEEKRDEIANYRRLAKGASLGALKKAALEKSGAQTAEELLASVNYVLTPQPSEKDEYSEADLQKPEVLLEYLAA